ncbi:PAS domain S-box protein [Methanosphaerula palustris]|uniref:Multi-sensor signal transduction histidine kinase n=1 Tax=Methanosphaerula palustris (strain ATCC BAA-1556 / DSM 19958 / E1-9c) TaxID=521011 RepID=B8GIL5_METPE|nr:PAS domain S-box protein [Methanosphaerula palustris]ACL16828.1 multi-sensor signal transduction histidine kinase [Methanosphaerula palustris E1-9c]
MYHVLYVDDEPALLELGKIFLEMSGLITVETALSAEQGIQALKDTAIDCIISDYQMPEIDGLKFLKFLRKEKNRIPFVLFTGRGREEVVIEAVNNGVDYYLQKGGDPKSQFVELEHQIKHTIERRRTEIELQESQQRMTDIINHLPDATLAINLDGTVIAWNWAMEEMTGVPKEQMLGTGDYSYALPFYGTRRPILLDLVLQDDEEIWKHYPHIIRKERKLISEIYIPFLAGGKGAYLWFIASPLYDTQGTVTGAIESIRDITDKKNIKTELRDASEQIAADEEELREQYDELKKSEDALRESRAKLEAALASMTDAIFISDTKGRFIDFNDAFATFHRFRNKDECARTLAEYPDFFEVFMPDGELAPLDMWAVPRALRGETVTNAEYTLRRKDTGETWVGSYSFSPILDNDGAIVGSVVLGRDITEKKRAEEALRTSEEDHRRLFETMVQGVVYLDAEGTITSMNPAAERILGKTLDMFLGETSDTVELDLIREDGSPFPGREHPSMVALSTGREVRDVVMGVFIPDEERYRWITINAMPLFRPGKEKPHQVYTIFDDITERKRAEEELLRKTTDLEASYEEITATEEELRENYEKLTGSQQELKISEERYRTLFENMLEGVAYCQMFYDSDGRPDDFIYFSVNAAFDRIIGTTTVVNRRVTEVFPGIKEAYPELFEICGRVARTAKPEAFDIDFKPSGKWLHLSVYSPAKEYFVTVFEDITERKRAERVSSQINRIYQIANQAGSLHEMLQRYVEEFRVFSHCEAIGFRLLDAEGNIPYQAYCGFPESFYERETPLNILSDECMCIYVITGAIKPDLPVATPGGSFYCNATSTFLASISDEERGLTRNVCNEMGYESVALIPIRTSQGIIGLIQFNDHRENMVPLELVQIMEEVALPLGEVIRRMQAKESLIESEEKYRILVENIPEKIFIKNAALTYVSCNEQYARDLGIVPGDIAGKSDFDFFPPELAEKYRADDLAIMDSGETRELEEQYVTEGKEFWISTIKTPLRNDTGTISGILGIFHDISERKNQELALRTANQKLNLMNIVAWHDIYNKVTGLRGYVELSKALITDEKAREFLEREDTILQVIHQQISYTKEYQEMGKQHPRWYSLRELLDNVRMTGVAGSIRIINDAENLELYADPVIEKVFWHLIDNSVKHGEKVTEIRITARQSEIGCTLVYRDDGVGIPEEKRRDLFTKSYGTETGFFLFFVHDLLEISGMTIAETGEPGNGVRFEITIPKGLYRFTDR